MTKPASDWIDGFAEEPVTAPRALPPARARTRAYPEPADDGDAPPVETTATPREPRPQPEEKRVCAASTPEITPYSVGFGKPPRHTQFQPGRSGNPRGRPKGAKSLNTLVRSNLTQKVVVRTAAGEKKITRIEAVLHKTVEQAMKGNPRALGELLKLYSSAVPEEKATSSSEVQHEDLTAADMAILEQFRRDLAPEGGVVT